MLGIAILEQAKKKKKVYTEDQMSDNKNNQYINRYTTANKNKLSSATNKKGI